MFIVSLCNENNNESGVSNAYRLYIPRTIPDCTEGACHIWTLLHGRDPAIVNPV